jgi:hypothetical protein
MAMKKTHQAGIIGAIIGFFFGTMTGAGKKLAGKF